MEWFLRKIQHHPCPLVPQVSFLHRYSHFGPFLHEAENCPQTRMNEWGRKRKKEAALKARKSIKIDRFLSRRNKNNVYLYTCEVLGYASAMIAPKKYFLQKYRFKNNSFWQLRENDSSLSPKSPRRPVFLTPQGLVELQVDMSIFCFTATWYVELLCHKMPIFWIRKSRLL